MITVETSLKIEFENEIKSYAKMLIGDNIFEGITIQHNTNDINKKYVKKFAEDLMVKGADRHTANRIAKNEAETILHRTINEIQGH